MCINQNYNPNANPNLTFGFRHIFEEVLRNIQTWRPVTRMIFTAIMHYNCSEWLVLWYHCNLHVINCRMIYNLLALLAFIWLRCETALVPTEGRKSKVEGNSWQLFLTTCLTTANSKRKLTPGVNQRIFASSSNVRTLLQASFFSGNGGSCPHVLYQLLNFNLNLVLEPRDSISNAGSLNPKTNPTPNRSATHRWCGGGGGGVR